MTTQDLYLALYFLKRVVVKGLEEETLITLVERIEDELRNHTTH